MTTCMDVYKETIQSDGILDKLKLRILVGGDLQNKEVVVYTCSPTASMRTLKYLLSDAFRQKAILYQLKFIGELLQEKSNNRVFVKLDSKYAEFFQNIKTTLDDP